MQNLDNLINGNYQLDPVQHIKDAIEIFKKNVGGFILYLILVYGLMMALNFVPGVNFAASLITPLFFAGFYIVAHKIFRNEPFEFTNFFDGFRGDHTGQIVLVALVTALISIGIFIPFGIVAFVTMSMFGLVDAVPSLGAGSGIAIFLLVVLFFAAICYILVAWFWSYQFVIFHKMKFWDAMEASRKITSKKFLHFIGFGLLLSLFNLGGMLALGVGLLFTVPVSMIAIYTSFEAVVGTDELDPQDELLRHLVE